MAGKKGRPGGNHGVHRGATKLTIETKEALKNIILDPTNVDHIKDSLDKLYKDEEYAQFLKLNKEYLEFFLPKQAAVTVTDESKKSDLRSELAEMADL